MQFINVKAQEGTFFAIKSQAAAKNFYIFHKSPSYFPTCYAICTWVMDWFNSTTKDQIKKCIPSAGKILCFKVGLFSRIDQAR